MKIRSLFGDGVADIISDIKNPHQTADDHGTRVPRPTICLNSYTQSDRVDIVLVEALLHPVADAIGVVLVSLRDHESAGDGRSPSLAR